METVVSSARYLIVVLVALISVVAGSGLLWGYLNPEVIAAARTAEILIVLGLILLPAGTIAAFEFDRRRRANGARADFHDAAEWSDRRTMARLRAEGAITEVHQPRASRRHRPNLPASRRQAGSQPRANWRISAGE